MSSAAAVVLLLASLNGSIALLDLQPGGAAGLGHLAAGRHVNRLLLDGGSGAQLFSPRQQQQLWNVSSVLQVENVEVSQLAGDLREPFLTALMRAAAAAAGGLR